MLLVSQFGKIRNRLMSIKSICKKSSLVFISISSSSIKILYMAPHLEVGPFAAATSDTYHFARLDPGGPEGNYPAVNLRDKSLMQSYVQSAQPSKALLGTGRAPLNVMTSLA